jgi:hypothetical protein
MAILTRVAQQLIHQLMHYRVMSAKVGLLKIALADARMFIIPSLVRDYVNTRESIIEQVIGASDLQYCPPVAPHFAICSRIF